MLEKVLDKIEKVIGIENFDDTKILTDTDDKLLDDIILIDRWYYFKNCCDINDMCYKRWW